MLRAGSDARAPRRGCRAASAAARRCGRPAFRAGAAVGFHARPRRVTAGVGACRVVSFGRVARAVAIASGGERKRVVGERVAGAVAVGAPRERFRWGDSGLVPRRDPGRSRCGLVSASAVRPGRRVRADVSVRT